VHRALGTEKEYPSLFEIQQKKISQINLTEAPSRMGELNHRSYNRLETDPYH